MKTSYSGIRGNAVRGVSVMIVLVTVYHLILLPLTFVMENCAVGVKCSPNFSLTSSMSCLFVTAPNNWSFGPTLRAMVTMPHCCICLRGNGGGERVDGEGFKGGHHTPLLSCGCYRYYLFLQSNSIVQFSTAFRLLLLQYLIHFVITDSLC